MKTVAPSPYVVAIIPARGGSKGVPRKNLRRLGGIPLVVHSIQHARRAACVKEVYVSTDDAEIAAVSRAAGACVVDRPAELSTDSASSEDTLLHAIHEIECALAHLPDIVVFLQCTSPLRRPDDIDNAVGTLLREGADSLLSVCPHHGFLWTRDETGGAKAINYDFRRRPRRQDLAPQFVENGSIYVFRPAVLRSENNRLGGRISLYEMPSDTSLDIDTEEDMRIAERMFSHETFGVATKIASADCIPPDRTCP